MGVDYDVIIFVGCSLEVETKENTTYVTKYNENTGEPYQKPIRTVEHVVAGQKFGEIYEKLQEINDDFLDFIGGYDDDTMNIGKVIEEVSQNDTVSIEDIDWKPIAKSIEKKLKHLFDIDVKCGLHVHFQVG